MKIIVCISNVPDTTTRIKFVDDGKKFDTTGVQWVINPWDELSLTRALELKDASAGNITSVTVAHAGPAAAEPTLRKALAMGADDAIRVNIEPIDAYSVAACLAEAVKTESFDIILCGIESSDFNGSSVGGMLAEFLSIPSVSAVSRLVLENGQPVITREIDGGREILTVPMPFVCVVQKGFAKEPRIASMRGIMNARTKTIKVVEPSPVNSLTHILQYELPRQRAACKFIDPENPGQLIDLLQNEAKII
jgi:electron transfer flavoprotein beta subunit